jgi:hypothetical protein
MPTLTLANLQADVYSRLDNNTVFYGLTEVTAAINEGIRASNSWIGWLENTFQLPNFTQPGCWAYNIPQGVLFPLAVSYENRPLERSSFPAVAMRYRNFISRTTANFGPVNTWGPIGLTKFFIFPADATGGHDIEMTAVAEPVPLVNPTDTIPIPDEFEELICEYAGHVCQLKESGAAFSQSSLLYQRFLRRLGEYQRFETARHPVYYVEHEAVRRPGE